MKVSPTHTSSISALTNSSKSEPLDELCAALKVLEMNKSKQQFEKCEAALADTLQTKYFKDTARLELKNYKFLSSRFSTGDILQDVYLTLSKRKSLLKLSKSKDKNSVKNYIIRTIKNNVISQARKKANQQTLIHGMNANTDISHLTVIEGKRRDLDYSDWRIRTKETNEQEARCQLIKLTYQTIYDPRYTSRTDESMRELSDMLRGTREHLGRTRMLQHQYRRHPNKPLDLTRHYEKMLEVNQANAAKYIASRDPKLSGKQAGRFRFKTGVTKVRARVRDVINGTPDLHPQLSGVFRTASIKREQSNRDAFLKTENI